MAKIVDEYTIAIDDSSGFPVVVLSLKTESGIVEGPYEFVPAYAHKLSDELCIASARATKKTSRALPEEPIELEPEP
jgi:hypothetical protein